MGQVNLPKWAAARLLHEEYGIDHRIIARVTDTTVLAIGRRAESEGWGPPGMAQALHVRLFKLVEAQFERIGNSDESIEKTARATAVVAKIVVDALDHQENEQREAANDRHAGLDQGQDQDWRADFFARVEEAARAEFAGGK